MRAAGVVISLCDYTGIMAEPWLDAGYNAVLVDPQHPEGRTVEPHSGGGVVVRVGHIISHPVTAAVIRAAIVGVFGRIALVAGFPPCTDVAVSGSRHFAAKRERDPHFQAKAALVAEQCRTIGMITGAPWFFENPVSVFSSIFGPADHTFDPWHFGGFLPEDDAHPDYPAFIAPRDAYPKKTCLWAGGGFTLPERKPVPVPPGKSAQYRKLGGSSLRTKNIRSATPRGFARAVFETYKFKDQ